MFFTLISPSLDPNELPKINTQFQVRVDILSVETKKVAETFIKYDSDSNYAQIVYKENNSTFSETFDYFDNQVYVRKSESSLDIYLWDSKKKSEYFKMDCVLWRD